jgi:hypothetical protein
MLESALKDVSARFLESTGRTSVTGIRYTTFCLLVAQALENMLAGYGGHQTVDSRYLSEAIGYQLGGAQVEPLGVERYQQLVDTVYELQTKFSVFGGLLDSLAKFAT